MCFRITYLEVWGLILDFGKNNIGNEDYQLVDFRSTYEFNLNAYSLLNVALWWNRDIVCKYIRQI